MLNAYDIETTGGIRLTITGATLAEAIAYTRTFYPNTYALMNALIWTVRRETVVQNEALYESMADSTEAHIQLYTLAVMVTVNVSGKVFGGRI
jgi:hypothetical protein